MQGSKIRDSEGKSRRDEITIEDINQKIIKPRSGDIFYFTLTGFEN
jgi:hypothetical protein